MAKIKVAVTYSKEVGGSSVESLKRSFDSVGSEVVDADYRLMMSDFPKETFDKLYESPEGRKVLFAHAKSKAREILKEVDCLAISGNNAMIDPELFNQPREPGDEYDYVRTISELALYHIASQMGMPILGVCGGHQVIAVYGGGEVKNLHSSKVEQQGYMGYTTVKFNVDSLIAKIFAANNFEKLSTKPSLEVDVFVAHAQIVSKLAEGFIDSSNVSDNQSLQSTESVHGAPVVTTQFHPEVATEGFPEAQFAYKQIDELYEMHRNIFEYFHLAAQSYQQKKTVLDEISQFNKKSLLKVETLVKNDTVVIAETEYNLPASLKKDHRAKSEKPTDTAFLKTLYNSIYKFFRWTAYGIISITAMIIRSITAWSMTKVVVSELRAKEAQKNQNENGTNVGSKDIKHDSYTKATNTLTNESPARILTEAPASLWSNSSVSKPLFSVCAAEIDKQDKEIPAPTTTV